MSVDQSFANSIDSTVYSETFKHSQFVALKMKDAICDYFVMKERRRPDVDLKNPDIKFHLHIDRELVTISLILLETLYLKRDVVTEKNKEKRRLMKFSLQECCN